MKTGGVRRLSLRKASYVRHYGPDDPRTVSAARDLLVAKIAAAEAGLASMREELGRLPAEEGPGA